MHNGSEKSGAGVLRYGVVAMSVLTMTRVVVSDVLLETNEFELKAFIADIADMADWLFFAFPNSLYFPFVTHLGSGWIRHVQTIAIFAVVIAPLSYLAGLALERARRRVGLAGAIAAYVALSLLTFWLTILFSFRFPWGEVSA